MTVGKAPDNVKALLLHVAVDKAKDKTKKSRDKLVDGGFYGPFSQKDNFEYIPIPESEYQENSKKMDSYFPVRYLPAQRGDYTYGNAFGERRGKRLLEWVPEELRAKLKNTPTHHDPNFGDLTYGEGKKETPRGMQCSYLLPDDLLVFCASLQNEKKKEDYGQFIIGYFTIENVYDFTLKDAEFRRRYMHSRSYFVDKYKNKNAHFSDAFARSCGWKRRGQISARDALIRDLKKGKACATNFLLVVGKEGESRLLTEAKRLTEKNGGFYIPRQRVRDLGLLKRPKRLMFHMGFKWINWDAKTRSYLNDERAIRKLRNMLNIG